MELLITENQYRRLNEDTNPFSKRWQQERIALKRYLVNYGNVMISKENGKYYKVVYDSFLSQMIGINFCICIQWDTLTNEPGDIIYVRAYDKFEYI